MTRLSTPHGACISEVRAVGRGQYLNCRSVRGRNGPGYCMFRARWADVIEICIHNTKLYQIGVLTASFHAIRVNFNVYLSESGRSSTDQTTRTLSTLHNSINFLVTHNLMPKFRQRVAVSTVQRINGRPIEYHSPGHSVRGIATVAHRCSP